MDKELKNCFTKSLVLLTYFICTLGHAQMGVQKGQIDEVEVIKQKPLLVVLAGEGSKLANQNFNEYFKKAVNAIWTFSPSFEFISLEDYDNLLKDKTKKSTYAYLDFIASNSHLAPAYSFIVGLPDKIVAPHYIPAYKTEDKYTYSDMFFYLTLLQNDLNDAVNIDRKEFKKQRTSLFTNISKSFIDNRTLLLDEALITEDLKKEISNLYEYNYKIVSKAEIDKAIIEKQENVVIVKKIISVSRPITKSSPNANVGVANRHDTQFTTTASNAVFFNSLYDTERGKIIFLCRPSFKDEKLDVKDFRIIKKAMN